VNALAGAGKATGVDDGDEAPKKSEIEHGPLHSFFH